MKKLAILLLAAVLVLSGCGGNGNTPAADENVIKITNLAELPGAIQNDTVIELPEGLQDISEAFGADYDGETTWDYASLEDYGDGFALVVTDVSNLTIRGAGVEQTELVVESPYADVLRFENCSGITVEKMKMGHLVEEGYCEGAVIEVNDCHEVLLQKLDLYGCGTYGVENYLSEDVTVKDTVIHDCSYGIVSCYDGEMNLENCQMNDCRQYCGIEASDSTMTFTGCEFNNNAFSGGLATSEGGNSISFERCSFGATETFDILYGLSDSAELTFAKNCKYDESLKLTGNVVYVNNPEELYEAIASDTSIVLRGYWYDLSSWLEDTYYNNGEEWNAAHPYVQLEEVYDGVMARISGVDNLTIAGCFSSDYAANITVSPRYADVFCFGECDGVTLANMTAGHTDTGDCVGNVVTLEDCRNITIRRCDLYGCGVEGIYAEDIENLYVSNTRVHDCSYAGINMGDTAGDIIFEDCDIYDNELGIVYRSRTPMVLKRCRLGDMERDSVADHESIELIACEPYSWQEEFPYDDYEDYVNPLEGREAMRFDSDVLKGTSWTGFLVSSEGGQSDLDSTTVLTFDKNGNATLEGFWEEPAHLTMEYDASGYYAVGYETDTDYVDAMLYLYAEPNTDESDLILELEYGEAFLYFN